MKAHLPNSAFLGNINAFLSSLNLKNEEILEITANKQWISIHPLVLAMVGALGKTLIPERIFCEDIEATSGHYLARMGLFSFLGINPRVKNVQEHEPTGRWIPLTQIKKSKDLDRFLQDLVPLLHLQNEPRHVQAIQHIFSELIRNVLEHAQSKHGAVVCAQYFKKSNKIAIGIADTGVGLRLTIGQSYSVKDHWHAIQLALTPGVTGTTNKPGGTAQNAGFGLFLIKSIAHVNSDFFTIISGDKMYKLLQRGKSGIKLQGDPFSDKHSAMSIYPWGGVAVGVDISLDQTEEFATLLDIIWQFYSKEVKGQKKERHKKARFT